MATPEMQVVCYLLISIDVSFLICDSELYFSETVASTRLHSNTIIVAPWFSDIQMIDDTWGSPNTSLPKSASLFWSTSNWMKGEQPVNSVHFLLVFLIHMAIQGLMLHLNLRDSRLLSTP